VLDFCCGSDSSTPYRDKARERHRKDKLSQLQEKRERLPAAKRRKVWLDNIIAVFGLSSNTYCIGNNEEEETKSYHDIEATGKLPSKAVLF